MDDKDRKFCRDKIINWLQVYAKGRENAKPRVMLQTYLIDYGFSVKDRTLRRIYAGIQMVGYSCRDPKGIFWITDQRDLIEFKRAQDSKAIGTFARTKLTERKVQGQSQGSLF